MHGGYMFNDVQMESFARMSDIMDSFLSSDNEIGVRDIDFTKEAEIFEKCVNESDLINKKELSTIKDKLVGIKTEITMKNHDSYQINKIKQEALKIFISSINYDKLKDYSEQQQKMILRIISMCLGFDNTDTLIIFIDFCEKNNIKIDIKNEKYELLVKNNIAKNLNAVKLLIDFGAPLDMNLFHYFCGVLIGTLDRYAERLAEHIVPQQEPEQKMEFEKINAIFVSRIHELERALTFLFKPIADKPSNYDANDIRRLLFSADFPSQVTWQDITAGDDNRRQIHLLDSFLRITNYRDIINFIGESSLIALILEKQPKMEDVGKDVHKKNTEISKQMIRALIKRGGAVTEGELWQARISSIENHLSELKVSLTQPGHDNVFLTEVIEKEIAGLKQKLTMLKDSPPQPHEFNLVAREILNACQPEMLEEMRTYFFELGYQVPGKLRHVDKIRATQDGKALSEIRRAQRMGKLAGQVEYRTGVIIEMLSTRINQVNVSTPEAEDDIKFKSYQKERLERKKQEIEEMLKTFHNEATIKPSENYLKLLNNFSEKIKKTIESNEMTLSGEFLTNLQEIVKALDELKKEVENKLKKK